MRPDSDVRVIHLTAPMAEIAARLVRRRGPFMPVDLLASQFEALEVPGRDDPVPVLTLDAMATIDELVSQAVEWLRNESAASAAG